MAERNSIVIILHHMTIAGGKEIENVSQKEKQTTMFRSERIELLCAWLNWQEIFFSLQAGKWIADPLSFFFIFLRRNRQATFGAFRFCQQV